MAWRAVLGWPNARRNGIAFLCFRTVFVCVHRVFQWMPIRPYFFASSIDDSCMHSIAVSGAEHLPICGQDMSYEVSKPLIQFPIHKASTAKTMRDFNYHLNVRPAQTHPRLTINNNLFVSLPISVKFHFCVPGRANAYDFLVICQKIYRPGSIRATKLIHIQCTHTHTVMRHMRDSRTFERIACVSKEQGRKSAQRGQARSGEEEDHRL